ncbi:hypothetical protein GCM10023093_22690 [Nemorincola caseinilytica]|uniref:histidine kinase n=1 Tax=Nemorincola caseinilytica TaxID=2054315 RepID=A0ABP8NKU6_9BACT
MKRISIYLLTIALCAAASITARAQRASYTDSLVKALPKAREDSNKANILYQLANTYFTSNTDRAISYGQQGVDLAARLGWKRGVIKLSNTVGNCYSYKRDYNKAVELYLRSLKAAEETGDRQGQAIAMRNIGNVYSYKLKDYPKAIDYYTRCTRITESMGDNRETAELLSEIGITYHMRRDHGKAIEYFKQAMGKGEAASDKRIVAENLTNISSVYSAQANYPQALDYALQSQKFYEAINDKRGIALALQKTGNIYINQKDYQRALDCFLRSLKLSEETGKKDIIADNLQYAGDAYISMGNHSQALPLLMRALKLADEMGDKAASGTDQAYIGKCYQALAENKTKGPIPDSLNALSEEVKLQRAFYYLSRGIDLLKETGDYDALQEAYEHLSQVQYKQGDKEGSRESYKQHNAYLESMYNQEKSSEIARKDMQYVFNKKQETMRQEGQQKEVAFQKELQMNALRHEYEMKQAAATSEREREQLRMEEELKQKQITFEYERKQADIEAKAALAKAELEKSNALSAAKLKAAKRERLFYLGGLVMLGFLLTGMYNRNKMMHKNKLALEEKNRQIAAEKDNADKQRIRAENSEKFKQLFLANMSHEIRTPMNAVGGMTDILLQKSPRPDQVGYLQAISKSSEVLLHIINDILDLSKIEAGKMELEKIDFSLADMVNQVKDTLTHKADEKGLQLVVDIQKDITDVVIGDPFRLNQVLINIGGNAIKFTERGSVQIELKQVHKDAERVSIRFAIIDTGIGIPADKVGSLFGNFAQVNASDTRKYGGTGLGLSISRQLVELHGGTISVDSVLGSGTTFHFTISYPIGSPEKLHDRVAAEKKADGSILNGLRVLVADDNEYNRIVVNETLMLKADIEIDNVVNGEEAWHAVRDKDYDVVLMDVQMPVMNGHDSTRAIRELPSPKNKIPIIALTASTLRNDIDACLASGMNGYVPKPFKPWQLINTMAELTGRKGNPPPPGRKKEKKQEDVVVAPEPVADASLITDPVYLHKFCEGDEKRIKKYINMYLKGVPAFKAKLKEAVDSKDLNEIKSRVHAFKPNWLIMGMKRTGELASMIEQQCMNNATDGLYENLTLLVEQTDQSVKELEGKG